MSAVTLSRSLSPSFYRLSRVLTRQTLGRRFALRVEGLEHLPVPGPAIICPKHQRWEDIPVIGMALPPPLHYIAKVELFKRPVIRELLGAWGGVPVDRANPRATLSSFRRLLPLLSQHAYLVLFPEGTYFVGRVGPGKHRLIQLLLKLQGQNGLGFLPFVPVGVAYEPRGWGYQVHVQLGPPLLAPRFRQAQALTEALMGQIARLSGF
ncbi:MAG TPA: lysophospholipid acyltransferase family protein [Desulfobaccales bacterium]|nr:lysophospholipid acyltransferase family protein [Desulfobaccales bacterium]